jgi:signal transduction histidine kinase
MARFRLLDFRRVEVHPGESVVRKGPSKKPRTLHLYWLAVAFATVAVAFMVGTVIAEVTSRAIDPQVAALKTNALPSIERLTDAEEDLRRLALTSHGLAESVEPDRAASSRVLAERAALDKDLQDYLALPAYPGERAVYDSAVPRLETLDSTLATVREANGRNRGSVRPLQDRLRLDVESVSNVLKELIRMNASQAQKATARIAELRAGSVGLAIFLDAASAAIAVVAASFALAAARRFAAAMRENAQLLGDRAAELEMFDQRVAHDLLSPLATVSLAIGVIAKQHSDTRTQQMVERAIRALERSRKLVDGILAFARAGARPSAGVRSDLKAALATAMDSVASAESASLPEIRVEPFDDVAVACDPVVLVTMLTNLLSNALKHTRAGPVRRVTVRACTSGGRVRAEIEDTGPGIPNGMEETVFDPYVRGPRVTEPGIGLGLATVKRFATAHGGLVGARRLGGGSLFWFELPLAPDPRSVAVPA